MRFLLVALFLSMAAPASAMAPPSMERYRVLISVQADGSVDVRETATIFTTATTTELTRLVPGDVRSVAATKDATPLAVATRAAGAGLSFWTLQGPDAEPGTAEYVLTYAVSGAIRDADGRRGLDWTIGGGWNAELSNATALVFLPEGVETAEVECLVAGAVTPDACTVIEASGQLGIVGTIPGAPLDVRVSWPVSAPLGATPTLIALAVAALVWANARYGRSRPGVVS